MAWNDEPQPTLTTPLLILRPFRAEDWPTVDELAGDRRIADTTASIPHPYPAGGSRDWIATHPTDWAWGTGVEFALVERDGVDPPVGAIGLRVQSWKRSAVLGYWIGVPFWGRGYATEAARAVIHFAFAVVGGRPSRCDRGSPSACPSSAARSASRCSSASTSGTSSCANQPPWRRTSAAPT